MTSPKPETGLHRQVPPRRPSWSCGSLLPSRGHTRCYRCRRPWWAVREIHDVDFAPGLSQFAMCEWCWGRSDTWWRFHAHHWKSRKYGWAVKDAEAVYEAIEALDPVLNPSTAKPTAEA